MKAEEQNSDKWNFFLEADALDRSKPYVGSLFGQRKGLLFSEVDLLEEADFLRCCSSEAMCQRMVERCRNENDNDKEIEPPMHFVCRRRDGQNNEGVHCGEDSVSCVSRLTKPDNSPYDYYSRVLALLPSVEA